MKTKDYQKLVVDEMNDERHATVDYIIKQSGKLNEEQEAELIAIKEMIKAADKLKIDTIKKTIRKKVLGAFRDIVDIALNNVKLD